MLKRFLHIWVSIGQIEIELTTNGGELNCAVAEKEIGSAIENNKLIKGGGHRTLTFMEDLSK